MTRALAAVGLVLPAAVVAYLQANPDANAQLVLPSEHFYIVTLVALMAAVVALLVARAAVQMEQFQVLLVALGFACLAGFFSVHALATPGILIRTALNAASGAPAAPSSGYGSDYGSGGPSASPVAGYAA